MRFGAFAFSRHQSRECLHEYTSRAGFVAAWLGPGCGVRHRSAAVPAAPHRRNTFSPPDHAAGHCRRASPARRTQPARRGQAGPGFRCARKKRDEVGFVGAFELHGEFIGTIRLVPIGRGLAPCDTILQGLPQLAPQVYDDGWEVGRLVLAPAHRTQPEVLKTCFSLTLMRFVELIPSANFLATCTPVLSRLYRRFGFSVLVKDACLQSGESYSLIHGNVPSVRAAVSAGQRERTTQ